jgi:hypothetical protein
MDPIVQVAEETEHAAISEGRAIVEGEEKANNWRLGELASRLNETGMTDQQIADGWDCSRQRVQQCRSVWDRFRVLPGSVREDWSWRSFREMLTWDPSKADHAVKWGSDFNGEFRGARFQFGPPPELVVKSPEPDPPIVAINRESSGNFPDSPDETQQKHTPLYSERESSEESSEESRENSPDEPAPTTSHKPPQTSTESTAGTSTTLRQGTTEAIRALRTLSGLATAADKRATAKKLRKLADELDPPPAKGAFRPPTVEQVAEYCGERENGIEAEEFCDYYESQGWLKANGLKLVDWHGAVRSWEKKDRKDGAASNSELNSSLSALARAGSG